MSIFDDCDIDPIEVIKCSSINDLKHKLSGKFIPLEHIKLSIRSEITKSDAEEIAKVFRKNPQLKGLDLSDNNIGDEEILTIVSALSEIEILDLSGNNLSNRISGQLDALLSEKVNLKSLITDENIPTLDNQPRLVLETVPNNTLVGRNARPLASLQRSASSVNYI